VNTSDESESDIVAAAFMQQSKVLKWVHITYDHISSSDVISPAEYSPKKLHRTTLFTCRSRFLAEHHTCSMRLAASFVCLVACLTLL